MSINIYEEVGMLLKFGLENNLIGKYDAVISRNEIMHLLKLDDWERIELAQREVPKYPNEILENICKWAIENNIIEDSIVVKDLFDTEIMGKLTPTATQIIDRFHSLSEKEGVEAATNDYYSFAQKTNYIRTDRIAKNMHWFSNNEYGDMEITVNHSKPEKDHRDIA